MSDLSKSALLTRPDLQGATEGKFKGWRTWTFDSFLNQKGPFGIVWTRPNSGGRIAAEFGLYSSFIEAD
ncbi:hypothetical protein [Bradyrhizobium iriomotense]|uniref:hypothetical protein n=1 Tax=Bradyrhizobium iriomotense TaxID=441950 RepID=UPI0024E1598B|nr:hypothetical protein [Bradyrhizobium iriomotense]